jgi:hypothetical protein
MKASSFVVAGSFGLVQLHDRVITYGAGTGPIRRQQEYSTALWTDAPVVLCHTRRISAGSAQRSRKYVANRKCGTATNNSPLLGISDEDHQSLSRNGADHEFALLPLLRTQHKRRHTHHLCCQAGFPFFHGLRVGLVMSVCLSSLARSTYAALQLRDSKQVSRNVSGPFRRPLLTLC